MRLRSVFCILLACFCLVVAEDANAQRKNKYQKRKSKNRAISKYRGGRISASRFRPYSFVGASVNALNYFGDLAPVNQAASTDISFTRPGFGLFWGRKFHHSMSFVAAFNYGRLKGDDLTADPTTKADRPRYLRNASFRNDIKELSAALRIHFLPNYGGPQSRMMINGYFFAGVAVFHHEPKGKVPDFDYQTDAEGDGVYANSATWNPAPSAGEWVKLRELGTEGQNLGLGEKYSPFQLAIPFGLGGEVFLNQQLNVGIELGVRYLFFDHLDDVSGGYVDLNAFTDPLARIMSDRSLEPNGVWNGDNRTSAFDNTQPVWVNPTFDSEIGYFRSADLGSGRTGFQNGEDFIRTKRGNQNDRDIYLMTRITVSYMLGNGGRAKFR